MTVLATEIQMRTMADGKHLYVSLQTRGRPEGVVVMVHGLGEYSGRYHHVVDAWTDLGLAVVRFDLRGHGRSQGVRGYVADYTRFLDDLSLMVELARHRFPALPVVVYGHSLGGGIVANWCLKRFTPESEVVAAVLSSPWLRLARPRPVWEVLPIRMMSAVWPWFPLPAYFRVQDLCRDPHAMQAYREDRHIHHRITARLAIQAYDAGRWALANADHFPLPVLAIHGGQDRLTSATATREFCQRVPRAELYFYEHLVHETHNEPEWRDVVHRVGSWIRNQVRDRSP